MHYHLESFAAVLQMKSSFLITKNRPVLLSRWKIGGDLFQKLSTFAVVCFALAHAALLAVIIYGDHQPIVAGDMLRRIIRLRILQIFSALFDDRLNFAIPCGFIP